MTLESYMPKKLVYLVLLQNMHRYDAIDATDDKRKPEIFQFFTATKEGCRHD